MDGKVGEVTPCCPSNRIADSRLDLARDFGHRQAVGNRDKQVEPELARRLQLDRRLAQP